MFFEFVTEILFGPTIRVGTLSPPPHPTLPPPHPPITNLGKCVACKEDLGEEENKFASAKKEFFLLFSSALFASRFCFFALPESLFVG